MKFTILSTLVSIALFASGCGPDESASDASNGAGQKTAETQRTAKAPPSGELREIVIEANDQMKFSIESFTVKPGEGIRLTLKNVGTMPKFSMGHNVVIIENEVDANAFADKAMTAAGTEYIPPDSEEQIVAHTKLLGGGEQDSVAFAAPQEKGEYVFLCSFPGHFQIGMRGVMTVE